MSELTTLANDVRDALAALEARAQAIVAELEAAQTPAATASTLAEPDVSASGDDGESTPDGGAASTLSPAATPSPNPADLPPAERPPDDTPQTPAEAPESAQEGTQADTEVSDPAGLPAAERPAEDPTLPPGSSSPG